MKKLTTAAAVAALVAGSFLIVAPVSAHNADLDGVVTCEEDGTQTVTWTGTLSNYGDHQEIDIKVIEHDPAESLINGVDGQVWLYEWAEHSANHGLPAFPEGGVFTYVQTGIPGTATSATTTYQFDWKNGPSGDPEHTVELPGDCEPPVVVPPVDPPVVVAPPAPGADGSTDCGVAAITLWNLLGDAEERQTASFVVNVDGEFYEAYAVPADEEQTDTFFFGDDTGDHLVEVYQSGISEWKILVTLTVSTDCTEPPVVVPPVVEPPVVEPPVVVPPVVEPPVVEPPVVEPPVVTPVSETPAPTQQVLASTGQVGNPFIPLAVILLIFGGVGLIWLRQVHSK